MHEMVQNLASNAIPSLYPISYACPHNRVDLPLATWKIADDVARNRVSSLVMRMDSTCGNRDSVPGRSMGILVMVMFSRQGLGRLHTRFMACLSVCSGLESRAL